MAFKAGTQIFTNTGFKKVEDLSGNDQVLVRNFLGDAQFTQPFALKKKQYNGEIIQIGGKNWSFSVTPEHIVVYEKKNTRKFYYEPAKNIIVSQEIGIHRQFKYLQPEDYKKEAIKAKDEFGTRFITISPYDWYTLCAYVLVRGYLEPTTPRKYSLNIRIDKDKEAEELILLTDILDRIAIKYSVLPNRSLGTYFIRCNPKNGLAVRLANRLSSDKRKEMFLCDQMIYHANKELATKLIETIITATKRADTPRGDSYQFSSNNEELIDSLVTLGTLFGYGMYKQVMHRKGTDTGKGELRKDVFHLVINNLTKKYSPQFVKSEQYLGAVYEIDLFEGQVYVREGKNPVWVNPK